jgi:hypothetical protein
MLALAVGASSCSKKEKPEEEKTTVASKEEKSSKAKTKKAASKPKVDQELVALSALVKTEEDFEEAVETEIVPDNLEAEVDKLEKELGPEAK